MSSADPKFPCPFHSGLDNYNGRSRPRTRVELEMCRLSAALRAKQEWWRKRKDVDIWAHWEREALDQGLSQRQVDYVLAELDRYATLRDDETGIEVSCFDGIWQSDSLVPDALRDALKAAVAPLENVSDDVKDWHPRSGKLVLDLVHPSLYPLVYTRSLVRGVPVDAPRGSSVESTRFAWLPTDFTLSESGARAEGYINNVHPTDTALYSAIERFVGMFVPLFERVLTDLLPGNKATRRVPGFYKYDDHNAPEQLADEDFDTYAERYTAWKSGRKLIPSEVPVYNAYGATRVDELSLRGRTVQMIVKLANIILTPAQPEYAGGSWHVEGMLNERIVASGIYYYDEENVTESRLAFREAVREPYYEPYDFNGSTQVWGLAGDDKLVQDLGSVQTKAGRCLAFPNVFQHRVAPFALRDRSRPGHRKILALFLVDPTQRIPSTSDVAPQQKEYLLHTLMTCTGPVAKLPIELLRFIVNAERHSMTRAEAFAYREELMSERTAFVNSSNNENGFFGVEFNMCEH